MVKTEQTGLHDATNEHDACGVGIHSWQQVA